MERIFQEYASGRGLYAIAESLTGDGIPSPSAQDRARNPHRCGLAWSKAAIRRFAPIAPARQAALYVEDSALMAERLGLRPADTGANVILAEPFDPVVFERSTAREGLQVVAASQLAADLLTGTGPEP